MPHLIISLIKKYIYGLENRTNYGGQGKEILVIEGKKIIQKSSWSWHSTLPITQHINDTLLTHLNMNYFAKCVSTYSFRGLSYYGSSFLRKEADQNVVWGGLVSLPCFLCDVLPAFAVGGYHLWENVHSSSKQQLTDGYRHFHRCCAGRWSGKKYRIFYRGTSPDSSQLWY